MTHVGFSTGNIGDRGVVAGIRFAQQAGATAIELSALREHELDELVDALHCPELQAFEYVSVHAPGRLIELDDTTLIEKLAPVLDLRIPIVVHPNIISSFEKWRLLGAGVLIENMDKRKRCARTAAELSLIFDHMPEAGFCFDIAHARQIDPTMFEAEQILELHGHRIRQIHISEVDSQSMHRSVSFGGMLAFRSIQSRIPRNVPYIFESPVCTTQDAQTGFSVVKQLLCDGTEQRAM